MDFLNPYTRVVGKRRTPAWKQNSHTEADDDAIVRSYDRVNGKFSNDCLHLYLQSKGWAQNTFKMLTYTIRGNKGGPILLNSDRNKVLSPLPPGTHRVLMQWDSPYAHSVALIKDPANPEHWLLLDPELGKEVNLDIPVTTQGLKSMNSYCKARQKNRSPNWTDLRGHLFSLPHPNSRANEYLPHTSHHEDTARPDQKPPCNPHRQQTHLEPEEAPAQQDHMELEYAHELQKHRELEYAQEVHTSKEYERWEDPNSSTSMGKEEDEPGLDKAEGEEHTRRHITNPTLPPITSTPPSPQYHTEGAQQPKPRQQTLIRTTLARISTWLSTPLPPDKEHQGPGGNQRGKRTKRGQGTTQETEN